MGADDMDEEMLKKLKREAAIRSKEEDFERRKKAEEKKKRQQLQELREEYENKLVRREQERLAMLKKQTELRARKKAENDRLNNLREKNMEKKHKAWKARADQEIQAVIEEQVVEEERLEEAIQEARARKAEREEEKRAQARDKQSRKEEQDMMRSEKDQERQRKRDLRNLNRVDALKIEARDELESFIQNPFPVPLKQVLAGRLRPVPKVTELLAAYKDQREDLEQLEAQDIPMRAQLRNQSIFQYVRDIQLKAEADRMRPPEPVAGDLMRTVGKKKQQTPSSPSGKRGKSSRGRP
mmetsp:Transcript_17845/g.31251  ORF Transcript_17845/g.31251 Transcript_17845/m.31251 type:complete len:297 (+) Transcript_17845:69-959(+)|eukprot:CAMPEP_0197634840 /NCGR_PEP_ID=MMETSP1338-20131121/10826_1 /TAXON_ID=43686 ORGANISM="Pelagodinium beii, Strain RCC1491" /NCGR_SAMPLE_ID=MMETSP1338 /ASSEMBLY_ACC=CAM_ASM_000754 /LENGTH=296 /DNA_ID=CAMNT_0043206783 /DNA_START=69 /DNA_END=959 /DNA_ORIENTATION=-